MKKRVFVLVLDSVGVGNAPDAADFGDHGANTLHSIAQSPFFCADTLLELGLGAIDGVTLDASDTYKGTVARLQEYSKGKDTTIGHWELAGVTSDAPLPTFPNGFPAELIRAFSEKTGRGVLCNRPYSGTQVIADYGEEHCKTGNLIVYTSADSVFQVAAHEDIVPPETLYHYCEQARELLIGPYGVGRVIARPFTGRAPFVRTDRRRDFSLKPPRATVLDAVKDAGLDCIGVGKIGDIFADQGLTESIRTHGNEDGMRQTALLQKRDFHGLCMVNLVDFDMLYGHRNDVDGYAKALAIFDRWLGEVFLPNVKADDAVIITADHGCDPAFHGTDHTRECVPFIVYTKDIVPCNRGTLPFSTVAKQIGEFLGLECAR